MEPERKPVHHLKVRFFVSLCMLALGFIGVIVTDVRRDSAWAYWGFVAPLYAVLSLSLSLFLHQRGVRTTLVTLWHEVLHWAGLLLAVWAISYLVRIGFVGRFEASLQMLTLLALATYLAGIYIEGTFVVLGLVLGLCVVVIGVFNTYLYSILIPLGFLALVAFFVVLKFRKKIREE